MKKFSTATDTKEISLTIYNGGFGAIKETRTVNLSGSETELVFADVAQQIQTDSLLVEGLNILEFNYDYDLVDRDKLLTKYVDKDIILKDRKTGEKKSCRLLSVEKTSVFYGEGPVMCVLEDNATKEIYINTQAEFILPSLPSGLIVKPALVWKIAPTKTENVRVSYLSQGFNWNANYVIELLDKTLNVTGWAETTNKSGAAFENVKIKLIAGDVKLIKEKSDDGPYMMDMIVGDSFKENRTPQAEEKSFFDYHMYTLLNPTTLKDNQTKQINILNGLNIPYRRYYQIGWFGEKVNIVVEFANKKESGLGIAIPRGKVKLYKEDEADSSLEFIGSDSIDHTPKDEDIKLTIGKAFDITFKRREVERKIINGFEHYIFEFIINNHKEEPAEVHFEHYEPDAWEMIATSHQYKMKTSDNIEFSIEVQADSEIKVDLEFKIDRRTEIVIKDQNEKLEHHTAIN